MCVCVCAFHDGSMPHSWPPEYVLPLTHILFLLSCTCEQTFERQLSTFQDTRTWFQFALSLYCAQQYSVGYLFCDPFFSTIPFKHSTHTHTHTHTHKQTHTHTHTHTHSVTYPLMNVFTLCLISIRHRFHIPYSKRSSH
jgi:hypothetical protein